MSIKSIAAFFTVWMFAFSMLSHCYCFPVTITAEHSVKAMKATHCSQDKNPAKNSCSPRFQESHFENSSNLISFEPEHSQVAVIITDSLLDLVRTQAFETNLVPDASPPPSIFLLHHAFLI